MTSEPEVRAVTGVNRAWKDTDITSTNRGLPVSGRNVTVALLDTGIDSTHGDLSGRVTKNIKLAGTQSAPVGFSYPVSSESLPNTDQAYGHGTFVGGVIAGNGSLSGGKFSGVAPNARLVGLSAGDLTLVYVLEGFDYLLSNANFANDAPSQFSGIAQPGKTVDIRVNIPEGTLAASVQISWGPLWSNNDLGLSVYDPLGTLYAQSNTFNLSGLTGKREGVTVINPAAGGWRASVRNTLGGFSSPQQFYGLLQIGRANYAALTDVGSLSPALREDIFQSLRSFSMWPIGNEFKVDYAVTRADLASAMVLSARVPQYLPRQGSYSDVTDPLTMLFVESAQASPTGALFTDVTKG
ncbi:MAG: S8 family serine peptidase, partial [Acidobacteriota bacterium]|nr:S8 family serine peptidase [Acidobacteriota bacterium]